MWGALTLSQSPVPCAQSDARWGWGTARPAAVESSSRPGWGREDRSVLWPALKVSVLGPESWSTESPVVSQLQWPDRETDVGVCVHLRAPASSEHPGAWSRDTRGRGTPAPHLSWSAAPNGWNQAPEGRAGWRPGQSGKSSLRLDRFVSESTERK